MFGKVLRMDLKRGFISWKFIAVVLASAVLLFFSSWGEFIPSFIYGTEEQRKTYLGAVDLLDNALKFDVFKIVVALLVSGLYTGSFCRDETSSYLRMVLSRTDALTYTRSKFTANLIVILAASVASCAVCCGIYLMLGCPFVSLDAKGGLIESSYYQKVAEVAPVVYMVMMGLQFGIVIAACSSVGLLMSSYQANMFICIGSSGFLFLILLSLSFGILNGTMFDVLNLVSMNPRFVGTEGVPKGLMFAWGMLYPCAVIALCCLLFERRMKWRAEHGII